MLNATLYPLPNFALIFKLIVMEKSKNKLKGKKVIILGGSSGLGLATAIALAEEGANVIIVSSNQSRIDEALTKLPKNATGYSVDLSKEESIKSFFGQIDNYDHLVYTAGESISLGTLKETEVDFARSYFNIRYWGALTSVKYGASKLNVGGSICLTSGIASPRPSSGWALGASICAAMEGFTRAMAVELAPLRVNIVSPGVVKTNLWAGMSENEREELYTDVGKALLVKRVGEADDLAQAFIYLMKQSFMTGQILVTDGGAVLV